MRFPLRFLIPAALLITGLVTAAAVAYTSQRMSDTRTEQVVRELLITIGNQAATDVAAGLRANDPVRVRGAIEHLLVLRGLDLGVLVDDSNSVMYSTKREFLGRQLDDDNAPLIAGLLQETRASNGAKFQFDGDTLYYANYIAGALPAFLGGGLADRVLLLQYDYTTLRESQRVAARNEALIIATAILLLSLLSWLFLRNVFLGRIGQLVQASQSIGAGDLKTPIPVTGNDEIAVLGNAMDQMRSVLLASREDLEQTTEALRATKEEIEEERASLADRVTARTRELTIANKELASARDEAEAASRAKSAFLATVSHEIRTPMNGVLGAIELLERSGLDDYRAPLLKTAQDSASSLLTLLNDLLDMAKIDAGRMEISPAATTIRTLVENVIATHKPVAIARKLTLKTDIADSVPAHVELDGLRVRQILGNFLSNAIKFTEIGDIEIGVAATSLGNDQYRLKFAVTDSGPGIPSEFMGSLFVPFEQGCVSTFGRGIGSGLGLAICRGLADSMGGSIRLRCPPGGGTQATFEITTTKTPAPTEPASTSDSNQDAILNMMEKWANDEDPVRVLVVEDHPANRLVQIRQLEQLGVSADSAIDGNNALEKLSASRYDVILTDCEMPTMDGFELAHTVRVGDGPNKDIPIVACTAHAVPEVAERCRQSGMNGILTKPMRLDDLAGILREFWPDRIIPTEFVPAEEAADDGLTINEEQMRLLSQGSDERKQELIESLLDDVRQAIEDIKRAVEVADFGECCAIAHRNKGACSMYGAKPLSEAFANLEYWAGQRTPVRQHIRRSVLRLQTELRRLQTAHSTTA